MPGAGSNAQSTAFAVQGLLAAGVDPSSVRRRGASPLDYLRSLIAADGHVRYARGTDQTPVWVTAQAVMALDGRPLPLAPVARRPATAPPALPTHTASTAPAAIPPRTTAAPRAKPRRRSPARPRPGPRPAPTTGQLPVSPLDRLASDAGIITAVLLAAVGAG
jgi:hypothetical protein